MKNFLGYFEFIINESYLRNKSFYVMGDYNIDILDTHKSAHTDTFLNLILSSGLYPLIDKPTRVTRDSATLIDNIMTNVLDNKINYGIFVNDISDHFPIFSVTYFPSFKNSSDNEESYTFREINSINIENFCNALQISNWSSVYSQSDADKAYELFLHLFCEKYNEYFPKVVKSFTRRKGIRKPWVTPNLLKLIKKKNKLFKKFKKNPTDRNENRYKKCRNDLNSQLRHAKKEYYYLKFQSLKGSSKKTWSLINNILCRKNKKKIPSNSFIIGDQEIGDPKTISNEFNNYFVNIGHIMNESITNNSHTFFEFMNNPVSNNLFLNPVSGSEILQISKELKASKSSGFDEIDSKVIKKSYIFHC